MQCVGVRWITQAYIKPIKTRRAPQLSAGAAAQWPGLQQMIIKETLRHSDSRRETSDSVHLNCSLLSGTYWILHTHLMFLSCLHGLVAELKHFSGIGVLAFDWVIRLHACPAPVMMCDEKRVE